MRIITKKELPLLLQEIADPPKKLYSRGGVLDTTSTHIAIVGTRLPSSYGLTMAYKIAHAVAKAGGVVVSGLAFGIDAQAHNATIDAGGKTVAVLASGVNNVTPSTHNRLADRIISTGGTLLSEYEIYDSAHKYRFLQRNRIISGLSKATIVIEAKKRSGALITARHAFDQNRDVYALPGDINRVQSHGCINLLRDNIAKPITSIDELLEDLGLDGYTKRKDSVTEKNKNILAIIEKRPLYTEDILLKTKYTAAEINVILSILELNKLIAKDNRNRWTSIR